MTTPTPIEEFNTLLSSSTVLFVICRLRLSSSRPTQLTPSVYRGHWCPFCQAWLRNLQDLSESVTSVGGKTLSITSEPASFLPEMRKRTSYSGDAIVDPENTLVKLVKEKYGLEVAVSEKKGYENGMAQPAVLILRGGNVDGEKDAVLEKWAIVPSTMNIGGAKDRPELAQVWANARAQFQGKEKVHREYKTTGFIGMLWGKLFG